MGIQTALQCDNLQCKLPQSVRQGEWRVVYWGDQDVAISTFKGRDVGTVKTKVVCCTACAIQVASELMGQIDEAMKQGVTTKADPATTLAQMLDRIPALRPQNPEAKPLPNGTLIKNNDTDVWFPEGSINEQ